MPKVRIFTTSTCPYCHTLMEFLKEHSIEFEEIDLLKDKKAREEIIKKTGRLEVPIIKIDNQIIIGFNKEKICQLLNID